MFTARIHGRVYDPCTRAGYGPCTKTRPCSRLCTGRVQGRTGPCIRVVSTAKYTAVNMAVYTCTRPLYTTVYTAISPAVYRPYSRPYTGRVHVFTTVYTVHGLLHDHVYGREHRLCPRPCTGRVHGRVHGHVGRRVHGSHIRARTCTRPIPDIAIFIQLTTIKIKNN